MRLEKAYEWIRVLKHANKAIQYFSTQEIKEQFCNMVSIILERTWAYNIDQCNRCLEPCDMYETYKVRSISNNC